VSTPLPPRAARCAHLLALALGLAAAGAVPAAGAPASPQDSTASQEPEGQPAGRAISLAAAVDLAMQRNPAMKAARLDVERRQLDVDQFENFWNLPQIQFDSYSGIVPAARGDIFHSVDTANDLNDLGPFYRFEVGVAVPIYTFGRLKHAASAARSAVSAEQSKADRTRDELTMAVVRAYWGVVATNSMMDLADDLRSSYAELMDKIDEKLDAGDIDPNDAWEARSAKYDIDKAYYDAVEAEAVSQRALAELLGESPETHYAPAQTDMPEVDLSRDDLPRLQATAARIQPQLRALRAAVGALDEAAKVESAEKWPVVLVGGMFGMAQSPNRDDQSNPFVYDQFNYRRIAAALNVRWDLNFARHRLDEMKVETRRTTRRWLRTSFDDFDLGIGEAQPLIKAYRADYRLQGVVIETQYALNVSLAELSLALGDFHTYVQWIADGRVSLD